VPLISDTGVLMRRTLLALAVLAAALVGAPATAGPPPGRPSGPAARPLAVTQVRTVHLITGDTVLLTTRADGSRVSRIVSGPHLGGQVMHGDVGTSSYLVPRLPAALRSKLDPSLYDVTRLARLHGSRVPVVVTLRDDAAPRARSAAGDALHLRRTSSGTVLGSYSAAGVEAADLQAVRSVRLAGAATTHTATRARHTLTIELHSGGGNPVGYADVLLMDLDDPAFGGFLTTGADGTVTAKVPEGRYVLVASTFSAVLLPPEFAVTDDSTVSLNLADATARPHVSMPGHRVVEADLTVSAEVGDSNGYSFGFSGKHFFTRVQPVAAQPTYGTVHTGVSAQLVRRGSGPARTAHRLAVTADVADGVPADLTFVHHHDDFARVVQEFYANGPAGRRPTFVEVGTSDLGLSGGQSSETRVPGRRVLLLQASRELSYTQVVMPLMTRRHENFTQLIDVHRYPRAGHTYRTVFAHGPVGPGAEGSSPFALTGRYRNVLYGQLPLFSGSGSEMLGFVPDEDGEWALRQDGRVIADGTGLVSYAVEVPRDRRTFELTAVSHPSARTWTLSTNVEDVWTFHSAHGAARQPILTPSYVPPSTLAGYVAPGRTTFGLSFSTPARDQHVARATVEVSTDGVHWRDARVVRTSTDSFRVRYATLRAHGDRGTMSIRVTGRDRHGNAVRETAMDVYRLR
jgi:hypothetical protein